ncbi:D-alanyl-D-alanine carboxypeptidase [Xanthobacter sp. KR7-65]|uniref:D-alanyl-D-alanine carboxypeptidase family protein n=1 Tax=Xanthobacter sp. KR7-65 TaxID=3156612 RepID=UPI0032B40817
MSSATCDTGLKFMRNAPAGLPLASKALAAVVIAAFSLSTSMAEAKPRKKTQVERSSKAKPRSASSTTTASDTDGSRWRYGSAAIIVDANTGKVLYEENADALRHPASVTKIMTLYLLFEQLEAGNFKLDSKLDVSAKAASQQPSKLDVKPGATIEVEDAIKALVTRSANDVAVVIAENVAGSESAFAEAMTEKARALGMSRTVFRNASGLPNPNQVTTARDLSVLGRAIQDRFPKYYKYFSTRTFYYRGQAIGNHNRLLGRIEGVDGIKTGYTQASGFNLVTSIKRDGRYLVGVVLGGSSGGSRDARMTSLITQNLNVAYAGGRTAPKVTEVADAAFAIGKPGTFAAPLPVVAARDEVQPHAVAPLPKPQAAEFAPEPASTASVNTRAAVATAAVKPGSAEPIKPVAVKTVAIQKPTQAAVAAAPAPAAPAAPIVVAPATVGPTTTAFTSTPAGVLGYLGPSGLALSPAAAAAQAAAQGQVRRPQVSSAKEGVQVASTQPVAYPMPEARAPSAKDGSRLGAASAPSASEQALRAARIAAMEPDDAYAKAVRSAAQSPAHPSSAAQAAAGRAPVVHAAAAPKVVPAPEPAVAQPVRAASLVPVAAPQRAAAPAPVRSGWGIQVGAFDVERDAKSRLDTAQSRARAVLGSAEPYTEKVVKGSTELYRARFTGLDEKSAKEACRLLKRNDFDCITIRN